MSRTTMYLLAAGAVVALLLYLTREARAREREDRAFEIVSPGGWEVTYA